MPIPAHSSPAPAPSTSAEHGRAINRRRFLQQVEVIAGGMICTAVPLLVSACAARVKYATPVALGDRLAVRVADVVGGGVLVQDPRADLPIYLRRSDASGYTAVSTRCTHRGCQVEPSAERMVCPCHGSEYTFAGDVLHGPAERALTRYRVTADAESVFIHLTGQETP